MPRQRLGKALACDDARPDVGDDRAQTSEIGIGGEQLEPVIDPRTGAQQQRQITREQRDILRLRLVEDAEGAPRRAALFQRDVVDQDEAKALDPLRNFARCGCGDRRTTCD